MSIQMSGKKVLVMVSNGVDESTMSVVQREMIKIGAVVRTAGTEPGLVNSWNGKSWGLYFPVDQQISQTLGADYDCLVVPSGARGVLKLAANPHAARIITSFATAGKQMAFMGDAGELLDKIDMAAEKNKPNVMTGDCTDIAAFIARMMEHLSGAVEEMKVAA